MNRTKRLKASDGGTLSIDRLSELPDSILCHILSFLETRASIKTSILARRWRGSRSIWLTAMVSNLTSHHHEYRLKIDTPALDFLKIYDYSSVHIESGMMTSLTEANICLCNDKEKVEDLVYSQSVLEFVNRLRNVKRLQLDLQHSTEIIHSAATATISFHSLTELELNADGLFLSNFLQNADNLEILKFYEDCDEGQSAWVEPEQVPTCLSSHLRTVKMVYIDESSDIEIVRYLLRNALILESIQISYCPSFEDKNRSIQEISKNVTWV